MNINIDHVLIAGQTGSGKSHYIHSIISNLMDKYSPKELKFFIADPKRVEMQKYNNSLFLLNKMHMDSNETLSSLEKIQTDLPFNLVVIIDTFSDLICHDQNRFEAVIQKLTSMTNVRVIMCDSRCSPDIFTDNIKNCFTTKIAFHTASEADSIVILGKPGAEKLKSKGKMLVFNSDIKELVYN